MTSTLPVAGRFIGQSVKRKEDQRLLTGHGRYVDDVVMPGMLHAAFLRSDMAKARITRIDLAAARLMPGVRGVFAAEDLDAEGREVFMSMLGGVSALPFRPLANGDVRFGGDPVAIVVAESRYLAEDACELIEVDYEPEDPAVDYRSAGNDGVPVVNGETASNVLASAPFTALAPDLDATFAAAAHVIETTIESHRYVNVPMEGRGIIASWDGGNGELEVVAATQSVHHVREFLSRYLGIPQTKIKVSMRDVGGGFGQKMFMTREETAVVLAAVALGAPVKWVEDRRENLLAGSHARNETGTVRLAIDDDNRIQAITVDNVADIGAYPIVPAMMNVMLLPGPYRIPRLGFSMAMNFTNTMGKGAYRGPWMFETTAREMAIDYAARQIGVDPIELRRRNILSLSDMPYTTAGGDVFTEATPAETLEQALEMLGLDDFRREQEEARRNGRWLGVGVSAYIEPSGSALGSLGTEAATVRLESNGEVTVLVGTSSHGQSIETTMAQVVADSLGVEFDRVTVVQGTTDTPFGPGTGGSRTAVIAGGAVRKASLEVKEKVLRIAAHLMEASVEDLVLEGGAAWVRGTPARTVSITEIIEAALYNAATLPDDIDVGLEANVRFRPALGVTWSNATHVCVVEVDAATYRPKVLRYIVSEDCGRMINPMVVEGQIFGGVVQGLGGVLLEDFVYDAEGTPLTTTFMDYLLPTTTEVPDIEVGHIETPSSSNPGGYKGMGEGGAIGSHAAVANAVGDALAHLGVRITRTPLGPEDIYQLVTAASAAAPTS
jgi:carbon-monoxide dehydrogenase large subunit